MATWQVMEAHKWWEKGQLQIRYPAGIPTTLAKAIVDYDYGKSRGESDRIEEERRKRKANSPR